MVILYFTTSILERTRILQFRYVPESCGWTILVHIFIPGLLVQFLDIPELSVNYLPAAVRVGVSPLINTHFPNYPAHYGFIQPAGKVFSANQGSGYGKKLRKTAGL